MKSKYRNIKINGYDSITEFRRAKTLEMLEKQGVISSLEKQVKYELVPPYIEHYQMQGKRKMLNKKRTIEQGVYYYADFQYVRDGQLVVEDVKGVKTKDYIIKRKLMLQVHGIKLKEV